MTTGVVESRLEVDGIRTPLISAGDPSSREAVVFLHGNPGSARDWVDLAEAVGPFARALAWDAPGFGKADKPAGFDYSIRGYSRFVDRALEVLGVERVHLVMHDFGGFWGSAWAAAHPDAFASVVLINTGVLFGYKWHALAKIWRTPGVGELFMATTTRPAWRMLSKIGNPRGLPLEYVDQAYDDFDTLTRKAVLKLYRATPATQLAAPSAVLRTLDRPALVCWGARDPYLPLEQAERQLMSFPNAELHILEDSGHWPFVDNPARTRELVVPFLRRVVTHASGSGSGSGSGEGSD